MAPRKVSSRAATPQPTPNPTSPAPLVPPTPDNIYITDPKDPTRKIKPLPSIAKNLDKASRIVASKVPIPAQLKELLASYARDTPDQLKLCDAMLVFFMLTGILQFLYCILITNYPFNAFLGGFSASVGEFVLLASLRSQSNPKNRAVFPNVSPERAFGDFIFGSLILHFFVFSYIG